MVKQDSLFLLIKSLSAGEKALVRKSDDGQAGYMALFDAIVRQRVFDERKLRKKLKSQGVEINYAYAKNYLTRYVLKCLRESQDSPQTTLQRQVQEIGILMARKVNALAEKLLRKAATKALEEERWDILLKLSEYEMALLVQESGKVDQSLRRIKAMNEQRRMARKKLNNLGEYQDLYYGYRPVLMRKQRARNEWDLELIAKFREDALLQDPKAALSARAVRFYHMSQTIIHVFSGQYKKAMASIEANIAHYRSHPFLIADHRQGFITSLLQLGSIKLHFGDYAAVERLLEEIRTFQEKHAIHGSEIFDKYYRLLAGYALETNNYSLVNIHHDEIREGLLIHADSLPMAAVSTLRFMMARIRFEQKDFAGARLWLNEVLDQPRTGIREDIVSLSRILLIFTFYETDTPDLVESASKATRKYLHRREQLYKFEARILKFLERHSFRGDSQTEIKALKTLRKDLEKIFADRLEANILAFFNILEWLDRKIAEMEA